MTDQCLYDQEEDLLRLKSGDFPPKFNFFIPLSVGFLTCKDKFKVFVGSDSPVSTNCIELKGESLPLKAASYHLLTIFQ